MTEGERADSDGASLTAELEEVYSQSEVTVEVEEIPAIPPTDDTTVPKKPSKLLPIQVITGDLADSFELWAKFVVSSSSLPRC